MHPMTFGITAILLLAAAPQDNAPADRVPWTASHLTGSPEPPPPLRSEPAFAKLKFARPVALVPFPGGKRYVLVEEKGVLYTFRNDPGCEKADLFIDLTKEIVGWEKVDRCRGVKQSFSIVFDPQFAKNRLCYVMYVLGSKDRKKPLENGSRISRFKRTCSSPVAGLANPA